MINAHRCLTWLAALGLMGGANCSSAPVPEQAQATSTPLPPGFSAYWHQGKAEVTSYTLDQARYGELHRGEAVLVYVTEDLSRKKQVKLDNPSATPDDAVPVLKLNLVKKFATGVYDYSIMTSTFTPTDQGRFPHTLKVTTSVQEWCGNAFTQLNLRPKGGYAVSQKSYFESEGDVESNLEPALLEDELWTRIRLNPATLPTGSVKVVPGTVSARLRHHPLQPEQATLSLADAPAGKAGQAGVLAYTVAYSTPSSRRLVIYFEKAFPHGIVGWEETYPDQAGSAKPQMLTTRATRKKTMMLDYWRTHNNEHAALRDSLGLK
ncbi:hypothetical protein [Hymenobacter koreensis]|uniref:Septum formation inhibitor Maf n=1 Tax=Hymenobacter koreensis TaxID=1084523 RepID=A0ABP8J262_9BACT